MASDAVGRPARGPCGDPRAAQPLSNVAVREWPGPACASAAPSHDTIVLNPYVRIEVLALVAAWRLTSGVNHATPTTAFRAVSYNVLAQAYVKPERYRGVEPEALHPRTRRDRLLQRIDALAPDLLCLQEVEPDLFAELQTILPGHEGTLESKRGRPDGCATFVRRTRFVTERTRTLHYRVCDAGYDHLALVTWIRDLEGSRSIAVANTHLRWQPAETPPSRHQGLAQLIELLELLEQETGDAAPLIAGDLNAMSNGPVIEHARSVGLDLGAQRQRPWDTALIGGRRRKLDYLLYSPRCFTSHPGQLPALSRHAPIPSREQPSDHLPLQVDFAWC